MPTALVVSSILALGWSAPVPQEGGLECRIDLPEGAPRRVAQALHAGAIALEFPSSWASLSEKAPWEGSEGWQLWAELLEAESGRSEPDPLARAALATLAAAHGRSDAAWSHFAAIGSTAGAAARALPALLPGAAQSELLSSWPPRLVEGATLRPALPPASIDPETGGILWTRMELSGFHIGEAQVALTLALEPSGVEISLSHLAGPAVDCAVVMPAPNTFAVSVEYIDWLRQDTLGAPLPVQLKPGAEPVVLWARFEELPANLPAGQPGYLPTQMREGGMYWVVAEDDPERARLAAIAQCFGQLLGVRQALTALQHGPAESWSHTLIRVPSRGRTPWLAQMAGAVEAHLLGDPLSARVVR